MIGTGTSLLLHTLPPLGEKWNFEGHSLTAPSNSGQPYDPLSSIEDFIRDHFGAYSCSKGTRTHFIVGIGF
jgi:hypothetical protein